MKHSEMLNLNLPEDNDLINVGHISGNFEKIDSAFQTLPVKQEESKTDIDVMAYPPYWTMHNATDEDIVYIDHNFFDEEFTIEAGQTIVHEIEEPENIRISSEVTIDYIWFIPASEAFSGGGGGGTSDYNKLNNLPTINNVEIKNNKTADDLGLVAKEKDKGLSTNDFTNDYKEQLDGLNDALASKLDGGSVGAAGGVAELGSDGKVPSSQLPDPVAQKEYRIAEEASTSYAKVYKLQQKSGETWSDITGSEKINIPKDMVVESGSVKECTTDNVPVSGYKKGDKYIDLVIANKADAHIYINVKDLIDNKAEGIQYSNTTSKLEATNVQSAIDEIAETLKDKVDETELSSAIDGVKTNLLSTVVASSNASASNSKTLEFQGTGKALEKLVIEGKTSQDGAPSPSAPKDVKGVGDKCPNLALKTNYVGGYLDDASPITPYRAANSFTVNDSSSVTIDTTVASTGISCPDYIKVEPNTTYYAHFKATLSNVSLYILEYDNNSGSYKHNYINLKSSGFFTTKSTTQYIRYSLINSIVGTNTFSEITIVESNKAVDFVNALYKIPISCAGKSSNIYLNEPLYDGEILDTESGSVDKIKKLFTLTGDEAWTLQSTNSYGIANFKTTLPVNATSNGGAICSNHFVRQTSVIADTKTPGVTISNNTDLYIRLQSSVVATVDAMKAWLKANPTYVIYGINATKETFDAPEIATTVGKNTLSINTDVTPAKVEVTSFGDYYSKAEVDKKISEVISYGNVVANGDLYNENLIDKSASYINVYYKPFSKTVIIDINLVPSKTWNSSNFSGTKRLCDIPSSVPIPTCNARSYYAASSCSLNFSKNNINAAIAINLISGEPTTTNTINTKIEYTVL